MSEQSDAYQRRWHRAMDLAEGYKAPVQAIGLGQRDHDKRDQFFCAALTGLMSTLVTRYNEERTQLQVSHMVDIARETANESMKALGYDVPTRG